MDCFHPGEILLQQSIRTGRLHPFVPTHTGRLPKQLRIDLDRRAAAHRVVGICRWPNLLPAVPLAEIKVIAAKTALASREAPANNRYTARPPTP